MGDLECLCTLERGSCYCLCGGRFTAAAAAAAAAAGAAATAGIFLRYLVCCRSRSNNNNNNHLSLCLSLYGGTLGALLPARLAPRAASTAAQHQSPLNPKP